MMFIDRANLAPRDGDLVVTRTTITIRAGFSTPARRVSLLAAKVLRIDARGRRWLTCADGSYEADDPEGGHTIIGVVTAVSRKPWRQAPPMSDLGFPIRPIGSAEPAAVVSLVRTA
jgi:hypothetical protein